MRRLTLVLAAAIAVAGCASAGSLTEAPAGPTPAEATPARPDSAEATRPEPVARAEPAAAIPGMAPERWWLLDAETDGVRGIAADRAYRELLAGRAPGRTVVVAIIDSGVDTGHEDLRSNFWVNEGEVPGNGRDDDGNGYADDVRGWNFIGGPDGRHVHHDTYEVTRLYARDSLRFAGADPDTLGGDGRAAYQGYLEIRQAFIAKRQETSETLQQVRAVGTAVDRFYALLRQHLGTDSLTAERVAAIASPRMDVQQARQAFLQLAANGITPAVIAEELERLEGVVEFGLNPGFDPRPIVGDDYADPTERHYGNPDVRGPDAKHGTHVAGIVAAERENGIGIDGVASAVRIMVLRTVPDGDERDKDVANAIRYAVDHGAHIINMSFGKSYSPHKDVVDAAVRHADRNGVLLVHGAGNDGADLAAHPNFPNRYYADGDSARHWIEVGATSWQSSADSMVAPFSNYGRDQVDVFAPGVNIRSTVPDNRYEPQSGTSMAAPVVSGLAALLMAYFPELSAADVRRLILESATRYADRRVLKPGEDGAMVPFGELSRTGGIVNAYAAVRMAEALAAERR